MSYVNFGRNNTKAQALASTNKDKIFFPTDSTTIILSGKEYGVGRSLGTTANDACAGNDPRLSDARTANGGNADTVDNKHADDFVPKVGPGSTVTGTDSYAIGINCTITGKNSFASGQNNNITQINCAAFGLYHKIKGYYSIGLGGYCTTYGMYSFAHGYQLSAEDWGSTVIGKYNVIPTTTYALDYNSNGQCFVIGNGTASNARSNAFRVTWSGSTYAKGAYNSSGADYAEYFEWEDGNVNSEDRIGRFVSLTNNGKIKLAIPGEDIIGVISGISSIVGNSAEDNWDKMYLRDVYGRQLYEYVDVERDSEEYIQDTNEDGSLKFTYNKKQITNEDGTIEFIDDLDNPCPVWKKDDDGNILCKKEIVTEYRMKLNPNYDPEQKYIPRSNRKEWDIVGLLGQMIVEDDGSCLVGKKCSVNENSIATLGYDYRVIKRIDNSHIIILANFL